MPQGLQVWDASGNLIVDTSTYTYKETYLINAVSNGNFTIPADVGEGIPVAFTPDNNLDDVSINETTHQVSWSFSGGSGQAQIRVALI